MPPIGSPAVLAVSESDAPSSGGERAFDAGILAHNEARRIGPAIRSLLGQTLPAGTRWGTLWVVASGCTDGTALVARAVDPRVQVIEEPERRGKAAALAQVFARSRAPSLVLLNADARARPDAVQRLYQAIRNDSPPYAASARPVVRSGEPAGPFGPSVRLLWAVHDRFQRWASDHGRLTTISDELLLLSGTDLPPIHDGIVNDGGFIAGWLTGQGRTARYVPEAEVEITPAADLPTYVRQRRRIRVGLEQTRRLTGVRPATATGAAAFDSGLVFRLLRSALDDERQSRVMALLGLGIGEGAAWLGAAWDRAVGRAPPAVWIRRPN